MSEQISVSYERKLSDGNYGSEGISFTSMFSVDPDENFNVGAFSSVVDSLRTAVLTELSHSAAERVAYIARRELSAGEPPPQAAAANSQADELSLEDLPF